MTDRTTLTSAALEPGGTGEPMIELRGVDKFYGDFQALKDINLVVGAQEVVVVIGPSGSGKSTMIRCVNYLEEHSRGSISVGGIELTNDLRTIQEVRRECGMVFQSFNLFPHMTVLDNITLGPRRVRKKPKAEAEAEAIELLEMVRIPEQATKFPGQLSGGQQQRVAIARALAMNPKVMLFDEPTSALDPELVGDVLKVIRALADEGSTMLIVTHELNFARQVSSRIVFLHEGQIEEEGPPDAFFTHPSSPRVRQFLSSQRDGYHR